MPHEPSWEATLMMAVRYCAWVPMSLYALDLGNQGHVTRNVVMNSEALRSKVSEFITFLPFVSIRFHLWFPFLLSFAAEARE